MADDVNRIIKKSQSYSLTFFAVVMFCYEH